MHEYSIIHALVDSVRDAVRNADKPGAVVSHIRIEIGDLAGVEVNLLKTAYEVFRAGTVCENASLEITNVPAQWACPKCDRILPRGSTLQCEPCDAAAVLTRGDEIVLAQMELSVEEETGLRT